MGFGPSKSKSKGGRSHDWTSTNEYLDADSHDDVFHNGYGANDLLKMDPSLPDGLDSALKLFPSEVAVALEDAERDALASYIGEKRRESITDNLEEISVAGEYQSKDGEMISGVCAKVVSAKVDTPSATVQVTIQNPEHLINDIMNGQGSFAPEFDPYEAASDDDIKSAFVANAGDYFDVYGQSVKYFVDDRHSPNIDESSFAEDIRQRIGELSLMEVAEAVIEAVEAGRFDSDVVAIDAAFKLVPDTASTMRRLAVEVIMLLDERSARVKGETSARINSINNDCEIDP